MKKVLAVVLCLLVLISSFSTMFFSGVSATANSNDFDDPANWVRYAFNTTYINSEKGTAETWGSVEKNTNTAYTYGGDASSLKVSAKLQLTTFEIDVEENKDYTLSYRFLTSGAKYNANGVDTYLIRTGIATSNGSVSWGQDGYMLYIDSAKSYTAPNGVFANRASIASRTSDWIDEGVWHQVTLNFNSGSNTKLKLVVQAGTDTFYLDDFSLTEVYDFENLDNWAIYSPKASSSDANYVPTPTFDGLNTQKTFAWCNIKNDSVDADNTGKSIKINGDAFNVAAKLPSLKANTEYTLKFKYKPSSNSVVAGSTSAYFTSHIIKTGTAFDQWDLGPAEFVADLGKGTETTDWKEISVDFKTDSSTSYMLEFRFAFGGGYVCYLDGFAITEKSSKPVPDPEPDPEPDPDPEADPFEVLGNWGIYHADSKGDYPGYATVDGTAPVKRDWVTVSIDNTNTATGNGSSVKLNGNTTLSAVKIPNLKANTEYEITFKYLIPKNSTWGGSTKAWFIPAIIKKGVAMNGNAPAEYVQKGTSPNTPESPSDGSWKDYTITFKTDDSVDYFLGITTTFASGYVMYLDEFKVLEKEPTPTPDPDPEPDPKPDPEPEPDPDPTPTEGDYDDAASWKLYHSDYNAPTVNGNGLASYSWINNTQNTDKNFTYNGGEKSIKFSGNTQFTAVKLNDLQQGKNYKLSFMYFAPTISTVGSGSKAWVDSVGIVKDGTAMNKNFPAEFVKKGVIFAGEAGKWHEYSMLFTAESTGLYFGMILTFSGGYTLYVDDFTITETDEDPNAVPVVPGKEPKKEVVIDFDNYGGDATLTPKDRIEIVEAEAYDGKNSKMLHFIKGQYSSDTTLNYNSTYATDTDSVFTVGVKPQKVYNISFRVKTNSQTLSADAKAEWIAIYATFGKKYLASSYQHNAKRDEWLYYNYSVTTAADQNLISFFVNAGESTPDMWIDDITITETDFEPFLGWGDEPIEDLVINFDDFYVNYDIACASIVDGPERDGKISKATYLKGGDYSYNVVANHSAVTGYKDPVFTVPCKENTLYEFSYYIYIPKDTGVLGYFSLYYDWANTWVLRASGMQERDQWVKKTIRFTTKKGQTKLSFTFNGGKTIPDIYLDDIRLKELKPGVVSYANKESYCEECFNIIAENNLVKEIEKAKTKVIKIPVSIQQQYILGITASSTKKSNSRIFLSFDGVNPMDASDVGAPSAVISADGKSGRYGISFISDTSGYVYLVIENDDGALSLEEPYLFLTKSLSTNQPMGFNKKQSTGTLSVNANKGELKELLVFGGEEDSNNKYGEDSNPSTGSKTVMPVVILFFTLFVACILLAKSKKGGEQA